MAAEPPITTKGKVVEAIDGHTYTVELPNGKVVHAHLSRRKPPQDFSIGELVPLQLNPYDFSRARICPTAEESTNDPKP